MTNKQEIDNIKINNNYYNNKQLLLSKNAFDTEFDTRSDAFSVKNFFFEIKESDKDETLFFIDEISQNNYLDTSIIVVDMMITDSLKRTPKFCFNCDTYKLSFEKSQPISTVFYVVTYCFKFDLVNKFDKSDEESNLKLIKNKHSYIIEDVEGYSKLISIKDYHVCNETDFYRKYKILF